MKQHYCVDCANYLISDRRIDNHFCESGHNGDRRDLVTGLYPARPCREVRGESDQCPGYLKPNGCHEPRVVRGL